MSGSAQQFALAFRQGNQAAFDKLMPEARVLIGVALRKYGVDFELVDECLSDVMARFHGNPVAWVPERGSFTNFLFWRVRSWVSHRHTGANTKKRQLDREASSLDAEMESGKREGGYTRQYADANAIDPADAFQAQRDEARLALLLDNLPPKLRAPIDLCLFQGLKQRAAAERLGVSQVVICRRLAQGIEQLKLMAAGKLPVKVLPQPTPRPKLAPTTAPPKRKRGGNNHLKPHKRAAVLALLAMGCGLREIVRLTGVSKNTVSKIAKAEGVKLTRRAGMIRYHSTHPDHPAPPRRAIREVQP